MSKKEESIKQKARSERETSSLKSGPQGATMGINGHASLYMAHPVIASLANDISQQPGDVISDRHKPKTKGVRI